jgi:hypothetical protein
MNRSQAWTLFLFPLILFFAFTMTTARSGKVLSQAVLQAGTWGGEHISLEVTENGARVEYDCAHGTIGRRIIPDRQGRFDLPGTYVEESGGPARERDQPKSYAVRYTGRVSGERMSFTLRRGDTQKVIGTYKLVRGQEPTLFKCR